MTFQLNGIQERLAIRELYTSALWAHEAQLAEQVREAFLEQTGSAPESLVKEATRTLIESLLQAPDEMLPSYIGDSYPRELVPQSDPRDEILWRMDASKLL